MNIMMMIIIIIIIIIIKIIDKDTNQIILITQKRDKVNPTAALLHKLG